MSIFRSAYLQYPANRRPDSEVKESTETMLQLGVKIKQLQNHLSSTGKRFITAKDLHNMRQKMNKSLHGGKTDEDIFLEELEKIGNN